ncbi:MAG: bifunctional phosphoribosyl-AMP cyclohydrolase/phosphoribosyl-ATP diphosphatase HisIE [bacterium]
MSVIKKTKKQENKKTSFIRKIDFKKMDGLVPAIVQDSKTRKVLMLGFMNKEALEKTLESKLVTFWSRSKKRLWQKGEVSNNRLELIDIFIDCDNDSLLITAKPNGPTCHTGRTSCFGEVAGFNLEFIERLYDLIVSRKKELPKDSYTTSLFKDGIDKIVQKIGEEASEVVIAGKNNSKQRIIEESCDLFYHLLVLLAEKQITLKEFIGELEKRHK